MKKTGLVYILVLLLLSAAAMLLRRLELLTVLDAQGLAVFRPATALLIGLSVLTAAFCVFFAGRNVKAGKPARAEDFRSPGLAGVLLSALCLLLQLWGAWLIYRGWKGGGKNLELVLALLAGLAGAGWLFLRLARWRGGASDSARLLAGSLVTLFYGLQLIVYYQAEAPEPSLVLTVYGFLALCAACIAGYCVTGGALGRMRPRQALVCCGLALYLSLVALVRGEGTALRLFWAVAAVQFGLSAWVLLNPLDRPAPEEAAPEEGEEAGAEGEEPEPEAEEPAEEAEEE